MNNEYETQPLGEEKTTDLVRLIALSHQKLPIELTEEEMPFFCKVIQKRIDVLKLPIKFDIYSMLSITCFCDVVGQAVVLLIDCLTKFEKEITEENPIINMTIDKLCDVYPWGFYKQKEFERYAETELKTRKAKWGGLY